MKNSKLLDLSLGENLLREWREDKFSQNAWDALDSLKENDRRGVEKLLEIAERGSRLSMLYLGTHYIFEEIDTHENQQTGEGWLKMASDLGSVEAGFCLASHYIQTDRIVEGLDLLKILSESNFGPAQFRIGFYYATGQRLEKDISNALHFFRLASGNGHLVARQWLYHISMTQDHSISNIFSKFLARICNAVVTYYVSFRYPNSDRLRR